MYRELKKIFERIILVFECVNVIGVLFKQKVCQLKRLILISTIFAKNCERAVGRYIGIIMPSETLKQEF